MGNDPFLGLVAEDNIVETLKEAVKAQEKIETEEWFEDDDAEEESSDEEEEHEDGEDEDEGHGGVLFYNCIGCKAMFNEEGELLQHIATCDHTY